MDPARLSGPSTAVEQFTPAFEETLSQIAHLPVTCFSRGTGRDLEVYRRQDPVIRGRATCQRRPEVKAMMKALFLLTTICFLRAALAAPGPIAIETRRAVIAARAVYGAHCQKWKCHGQRQIGPDTRLPSWR